MVLGEEYRSTIIIIIIMIIGYLEPGIGYSV